MKICSVSKTICIDKTTPISISNLVSFYIPSLYYIELPELFIVASFQINSGEASSRLAIQESSCLFFLEPEVSWPCAQESNDNHCFESDENSPYPHRLFMFDQFWYYDFMCAHIFFSVLQT